MTSRRSRWLASKRRPARMSAVLPLAGLAVASLAVASLWRAGRWQHEQREVDRYRTRRTRGQVVQWPFVDVTEQRRLEFGGEPGQLILGQVDGRDADAGVRSPAVRPLPAPLLPAEQLLDRQLGPELLVHLNCRVAFGRRVSARRVPGRSDQPPRLLPAVLAGDLLDETVL